MTRYKHEPTNNPLIVAEHDSVSLRVSSAKLNWKVVLGLSVALISSNVGLIGCSTVPSQSTGRDQDDRTSQASNGVVVESSPLPANDSEKVVIEYCSLAGSGDSVGLRRLILSRSFKVRKGGPTAKGAESPSYDLVEASSRRLLEKEIPAAIRSAKLSVTKIWTLKKTATEGVVSVSLRSEFDEETVMNFTFELSRVKGEWKIYGVSYTSDMDGVH